MARQPERPLNKCMGCGGGGVKPVARLQESVQWVNDPKNGKKEKVVTRKTVVVQERCKSCGGTGIR
jgi:hypothetical protein